MTDTQTILTERAFQTVWTIDLVKRRLVEAYEIERRMPREMLAKFDLKTSWPGEVLHTFADRVNWTDERQRVWDAWARSKGVASYEVSRMEEALDWLGWIQEGERNCLKRWAACKAFGRNPLRVIRAKQITKTTFYRKVNQGAMRIADLLNRRGVQIR